MEGELQQARSEIKELNDKLKPLSVRLEELENLLENKDRQVQELAQKIAAVQADNDSHAAREAELEQEIAQSKQSQAEAEALAMLYLQETKAAEEKLASVEGELRVVLEEQQNKFDIVDIEPEDDGHDGVVDSVVTISCVGRYDQHGQASLTQNVALENLVKAAIFCSALLLTVLFWWNDPI